MDHYIEMIKQVALKPLPYEFDRELTEGNRLVLCNPIGQGGFAITYKGRYYDRKGSNLANANEVYTKVIVKEFFLHDACFHDANNTVHPIPGKEELFSKYLDKFENESRALQELRHEFIVNVYADFRANGTSYYVMEEIVGNSLTLEVDHNGCLSLPAALAMLETAIDALRFVHKNKYLHLDITPNNILVQVYSNKYKSFLIDFGLCRTINELSGEIRLSTVHQAVTEGYSSRELVSPEYDKDKKLNKLTPASDIYSLAATLYFLLTGIHPKVPDELNISGLPYPDYADPRGKFVLEKAMRINCAERTQTIDHFIELCNEALKQPLPEEYDPWKRVPRPKNIAKVLSEAPRIPLSALYHTSSEPKQTDEAGDSPEKPEEGSEGTVVMDGDGNIVAQSAGSGSSSSASSGSYSGIVQPHDGGANPEVALSSEKEPDKVIQKDSPATGEDVNAVLSKVVRDAGNQGEVHVSDGDDKQPDNLYSSRSDDGKKPWSGDDTRKDDKIGFNHEEDAGGTDDGKDDGENHHDEEQKVYDDDGSTVVTSTGTDNRKLLKTVGSAVFVALLAVLGYWAVHTWTDRQVVADKPATPVDTADWYTTELTDEVDPHVTVVDQLPDNDPSPNISDHPDTDITSLPKDPTNDPSKRGKSKPAPAVDKTDSASGLTDAKLTALLTRVGSGVTRATVKQYFSQNAYFLITNGSAFVGSPNDPYHSIDRLMDNHYIDKEGYRVVDITVNPKGLIDCIIIRK